MRRNCDMVRTLFHELMTSASNLQWQLKLAEVEMFRELTCDGPLNVPDEFKWGYHYYGDGGMLLCAQPKRLYQGRVTCVDDEGNEVWVGEERWAPMETAILLEQLMAYIEETQRRIREHNDANE